MCESFQGRRRWGEEQAATLMAYVILQHHTQLSLAEIFTHGKLNFY